MSLFNLFHKKPKAQAPQTFDQGAQTLLASLGISNGAPTSGQTMYGPQLPSSGGGASLAGMNISQFDKPVKPVKAVKQQLSSMGLGGTFGGSTVGNIKAAGAQPGFDPLQYTLTLIANAKNQGKSASQQWAQQPANPMSPSFNANSPRNTLPMTGSQFKPLSAFPEKNNYAPMTPAFANLLNRGGSGDQFGYDDSGLGGGNDYSFDTNMFDSNGNFSDNAGTGTNLTGPGGPMIDQYASDWENNPDRGSSDLITQANNMNDLRNKIATGVTDPYNLGVGSNVPFTAAQLQGIEKGLAGSMDPAINDLKSRILSRQKIEENNQSGGTSYGFGSNPALDVILGSGKFTKDQKNLIIQSIQSGSDPTTVILNQAKGLMNGPEATSVTKSEQALASMQSLDSLLKQYYSNGGKTSLLSGTYENVLNKLGTLKDPKLVGIGVSIATALQKYRNAVSGTAFSVQEGREMKSVFPSITNTQGLNDVITQARINSLKDEVDSAYRLVLGSAYDSLQQNGTGGSTGDIRVINGQQFKLNPADGKYYPFSKVGGGTNSAIKTVDDAMRRIARNESDGSGGYRAIGPKLTKGSYAGQRAIGKYQVMEGNIGPWSREVLGRTVTPQEFYNSPQIQDAIARAKLSQYYKKYGNWGDAASAWFTGGSLAYGKNKKDAFGTTGAQYVNNFLA